MNDEVATAAGDGPHPLKGRFRKRCNL